MNSFRNFYVSCGKNGSHSEMRISGCDKFKTAFRTHHIPQCVINLKKKEFQDLRQGSMSVNEYVTHFTQRLRYTPNDVDTYEKK
jgi:hypothetical protein